MLDRYALKISKPLVDRVAVSIRRCGFTADQVTLFGFGLGLASALCVGFGLSRPEHVRDVVEAGADGAIVGSALVQTIETHAAKPRLMLQKLLQQTRALISATRLRS